MLEPKPKSICMAPSVAVCCGLSSSKLRTAGSKVVSELHSRGFARLGDVRGEEATGEEARGRDVDGNTGDWEANEVEAWAFSGLLPLADLGTEKVNEDCLSDRFSF